MPTIDKLTGWHFHFNFTIRILCHLSFCGFTLVQEEKMLLLRLRVYSFSLADLAWAVDLNRFSCSTMATQRRKTELKENVPLCFSAILFFPVYVPATFMACGLERLTNQEARESNVNSRQKWESIVSVAANFALFFSTVQRRWWLRVVGRKNPEFSTKVMKKATLMRIMKSKESRQNGRKLNQQWKSRLQRIWKRWIHLLRSFPMFMVSSGANMPFKIEVDLWKGKTAKNILLLLNWNLKGFKRWVKLL